MYIYMYVYLYLYSIFLYISVYEMISIVQNTTNKTIINTARPKVCG